MIVNEQIANECRETAPEGWIRDVPRSKPFTSRNFNVPEASGSSAPCGGRSALTRRTRTSPECTQSACFVAWFNAALRAIDIRDSLQSQGSRYTSREDRQDRQALREDADGAEPHKVAIQTNNLEVDDRGYIYIVDRANTGMHILQVTGAAREIAKF